MSSCRCQWTDVLVVLVYQSVTETAKAMERVHRIDSSKKTV